MIRMMKQNVLISVILCAAFFGCGEAPDVQAPALSEEKLIEIYVNISLIQESDQGAAEKRARIFAYADSSGVSYAEVEERLAYYKSDHERWRSFNQQVLDRLEEISSEEKVPVISEDDDG